MEYYIAIKINYLNTLTCGNVNDSHRDKDKQKKMSYVWRGEDGGNIGGSGIHFPATPGKYLADLRSRTNSQQYSSIYEVQRPKIEDTERSDGKKSAQGQ